MYHIRHDPAEGVLHLTLSGFWTTETMAAFAADLMRQTTALRAQGHRFGVLSDSRSFPIQSGAVADRFEAIKARGAGFAPVPTAIVVGSMLSKLQAERSLQDRLVRIFLDIDEARAWLTAELAGARA